jgi:hypothetical protein
MDKIQFDNILLPLNKKITMNRNNKNYMNL